jgi:DNA-binding LacI/PurR family transcriptional regulator
MHAQLRNAILAQIANGGMAAGSRLPDERTLAQELKISRTTVRRAFLDLVKQGALVRMRRRGTFVAATRAATPRPSGGEAIAVIAPPTQVGAGQTLFYHRILDGLQDAAERLGRKVFLRRMTEDAAGLVATLNADAQTGGVVVLGIVDPAVLHALAGLTAPVVMVDSGPVPPDANWDSVEHDAQDGAYQAVAYLLQLGHRRIGLLNYLPETTASRQREAGYARALAQYGLSVQPEWIFRGPLSVPSAYATTRHVLARSQKLTALFCTSDELALGAMAAAQEHDLDIPEDISIAGFGDLGHISVPALSSVRISLEQMGAMAADLLEQRSADRARPGRRIVMPVEFVARGSCDCPLETAAAGEVPAATPAR